MEQNSRQGKATHRNELAPGPHVLVVGGAGYIGSVLVRELLSQGYRVKVLDNLIYDNGSSIRDLTDNPRFSFAYGDLCDGITRTGILQGIEHVILLAALVGDPICKKYPEKARRVNLDGSKALFDSLNNQGIKKFVFASTCSNYGLKSDGTFATEESELNPQSLYAETKVAVEQHILGNAAQVDFSSTVLRVSTAYGVSPRMRFDLTISEFTRELALGRDLLVYDEATWRPYCHVLDISDAIIRVLESEETKVRGQVFNVGSDSENYTKKMIVDMIVKVLGNGNPRYKQGGHDPRNYRVSFGKIMSVLSFKNRFTVQTSIPRLIHGLRSGLFDDVETRKQFYGNYQVKEI